MSVWCGQMDVVGWIAMVAGWGIVIGVVVWAVQRIFPAPQTPSDAKSLLDARLASGDIDLPTYQSIRAAVNDSAAVNHEGTR